jgi:hypothetical protein
MGTADPNAGIASSGAVASNVYTGGTTSDTHGQLVPNAANLKQIIQQQFGITDIGGYRAPDGYNEHSSGQALDIMVGANKQLGDQVNAFLLKNAAALGIQYDLWQQTQWNPDGTTSGMSDRGSPTANHRDHVHARVRPGMASGIASGAPISSAYPSVDTGTGLTSNDLTLRNAQQRVNDTQHSQEQAEARLNELRAKGTATDRQLEAAEYAVAKAKREHSDAIDSLSVATDKYNDKAAKGQGKGGDSGMSSLGTDLMGGIAQFFGFDGSLFADPTQFGLMKFITGAANLKVADSGNGMAPTGGGGSGLFDLATQFMPGMPGGNSPNLMDAVQFSQTGGPNSPGPGNNSGYQNTGIDMRGAQLGVDPNQFNDHLNSITSSQNRWGPLLQNAPK